MKVLHKIIEDSGAKIVFNTTHNMHLEESTTTNGFKIPGLLNSFRDAGFEDHIHEKVNTNFKVGGRNRLDDRLEAIKEFNMENLKDQDLWVAFDDCAIDHKRAYLTDFDHGIGLGEYLHAQHYLQFKSSY